MEGRSFGRCYNDSCSLAKASLPLIGVLFAAKGNNLSLGFGENLIKSYVSHAKVRWNGNDNVRRRSFLSNNMTHKRGMHWKPQLSL